jgi:hypothetical protein
VDVSNEYLLPLLEAACHYQFHSLVQKLSRPVADLAEPENCLLLYQKASLLLEGFPVVRCIVDAALRTLSTEFPSVIKTYAWRQLPQATVEELLRNDALNVAEIEALDAVERWVRHDEQQRRANAVSLLTACVRLPLLTPMEINDRIVKSPLWRSADLVNDVRPLVVDSLLYHSARVAPQICTTRRRKTDQHRITRKSPPQPENFMITSCCEEFTVSVGRPKPVYLAGVGLWTSEPATSALGAFDALVTLGATSQQKQVNNIKLTLSPGSFKWQGTVSSAAGVKFAEPIQLVAGTAYKLAVEFSSTVSATARVEEELKIGHAKISFIGGSSKPGWQSQSFGLPSLTFEY